MKIALFPGSFNPFTIGHEALVKRMLELFDEVVIAVGYNTQKAVAAEVSARVDVIKGYYANEARVRVVSYSTLTVDCAKACGATCIIRGVRTVADFEYERSIAEVNRQLSGIETLLLVAEPELAYVSSSMVRELNHFGKDIKPYLPKRD